MNQAGVVDQAGAVGQAEEAGPEILAYKGTSVGDGVEEKVGDEDSGVAREAKGDPGKKTNQKGEVPEEAGVQREGEVQKEENVSQAAEGSSGDPPPERMGTVRASAMYASPPKIPQADGTDPGPWRRNPRSKGGALGPGC
ncbi:hypothetical protein A0H81_01223 [Grifola frondosa]|uniref:Uncharacterized protein n=1 Tax=Grifola frondosa TaxID=5627 RepID=A0A1C7MRL2_GRIFR|nr:hypothetical protein A0H81_01223 [Grifola frondosa]